MTTEHPFRRLLHQAGHRIPGVAPHAEQPPGHQGTTAHAHEQRRNVTPHRSPAGRRNHSPARPPRFLPAWQRRIAAFFGRDLG